MSWRDTTPASVQDDLDGVVGAAVQAAEHHLARRGEFFPFGLTVTAEGEVALAAADPGIGEHPDSQAVLESLYKGVRSDAARLRAAAFVADVEVDGSDAIRVEAEHRDGGPAIQVLTPYARRGEELVLDAPSVAAGIRHVWVHDE